MTDLIQGDGITISTASAASIEAARDHYMLAKEWLEVAAENNPEDSTSRALIAVGHALLAGLEIP